jgi:hypothetical protein
VKQLDNHGDFLYNKTITRKPKMNILLTVIAIAAIVMGALIIGVLSCISDDIETLKDKIDLLMKEKKIQNRSSNKNTKEI